MTAESLLKRAVSFYASSHDANGLPARTLITESDSLDSIKDTVIDLVEAGELEVVFEETDINAHIQRLPRRFRKPFAELMEQCELENACLYPSPSVIQAQVDLSPWKKEPYTLRLWEGGSHLDVVYFDLAVLERYRNDPRYLYSQDFFGGYISLKDKHYETMPERDHAFIQRFGIGYDADGHWVIGVILSDLCGLSPEHQRVWREYEREDDCKLNQASFDAWFLGKWSDFDSIFHALTEELGLISEMTERAFGKKLFKGDVRGGAFTATASCSDQLKRSSSTSPVASMPCFPTTSTRASFRRLFRARPP